MAKIGVFGGSFDPVHVGHTTAARGVARRLGLDRVLMIPVCDPPHKTAAGGASARDRLEMCRLACEGDPLLTVCDMEIRRGGVSYTYETLTELKKRQSADELYLICGTDMFLTITDWKRSDIILRLAVICAAPRGDYPREETENAARRIREAGGRCVICPLPKVDVSSTRIRRLLRENSSAEGLLPPGVEQYIRTRGLYGACANK